MPRQTLFPLPGAAIGALTQEQPDGEAEPRHVTELQHQVDVEDDAQRWGEGYQGDLQEKRSWQG